MTALLANENFPQPALRLLRENGVIVESVEELMPGANDADVMSYAHQKGLWLVTFDRDYGELVFARGMPCPPVVIYLRQEPFPSTRPAETLMELLSKPDEVEGMFDIVSSRLIRKRKLPTR
jgi:predicted nuclease of predicted toxin-antitoxin system